MALLSVTHPHTRSRYIVWMRECSFVQSSLILLPPFKHRLYFLEEKTHSKRLITSLYAHTTAADHFSTHVMTVMYCKLVRRYPCVPLQNRLVLVFINGCVSLTNLYVCDLYLFVHTYEIWNRRPVWGLEQCKLRVEQRVYCTCVNLGNDDGHANWMVGGDMRCRRQLRKRQIVCELIIFFSAAKSFPSLFTRLSAVEVVVGCVVASLPIVLSSPYCQSVQFSFF